MSLDDWDSTFNFMSSIVINYGFTVIESATPIHASIITISHGQDLLLPGI